MLLEKFFLSQLFLIGGLLLLAERLRILSKGHTKKPYFIRSPHFFRLSFLELLPGVTGRVGISFSSSLVTLLLFTKPRSRFIGDLDRFMGDFGGTSFLRSGVEGFEALALRPLFG